MPTTPKVKTRQDINGKWAGTIVQQNGTTAAFNPNGKIAVNRNGTTKVYTKPIAGKRQLESIKVAASAPVVKLLP
jgi:hypothetical protein